MRYPPGSYKRDVMQSALNQPVLIEYPNNQEPLGDRQYYYLVRTQARRNGNRAFDELTFHPVENLLLIGTKEALRGLKKKDAHWLRQNL